MYHLTKYRNKSVTFCFGFACTWINLWVCVTLTQTHSHSHSHTHTKQLSCVSNLKLFETNKFTVACLRVCMCVVRRIGLLGWHHFVCGYCYGIVRCKDLFKFNVTVIGRTGHKLHTAGANLFELGGEIIVGSGIVYWCRRTYFPIHWWSSKWAAATTTPGETM